MSSPISVLTDVLTNRMAVQFVYAPFRLRSWTVATASKSSIRCWFASDTGSNWQDGRAVAAAQWALDWLKETAAEPGGLHLVYVDFVDKCEVHTHPYLAMAWQRKGQPMKAPAAREDQQFTVFGAVDYATGQVIQVIRHILLRVAARLMGAPNYYIAGSYTAVMHGFGKASTPMWSPGLRGPISTPWSLN